MCNTENLDYSHQFYNASLTIRLLTLGECFVEGAFSDNFTSTDVKMNFLYVSVMRSVWMRMEYA